MNIVLFLLIVIGFGLRHGHTVTLSTLKAMASDDKTKILIPVYAQFMPVSTFLSGVGLMCLLFGGVGSFVYLIDRVYYYYQLQ